ncbi:TPA: LCP family protein [Enterococcus faecalis]|uniref:LCP family glycopolymer transferase n=1 Tax=Enterococcus faecalis TaxID=1351 RepID=UPI000D513A10|nr:LCP family protein [Enterococcus faecalis]EGO5147587.1 LytR family transcriptional regulator [Enterococcus faecalis]EHA3057113.1 LytR family transcriptional regulator [Enterococcus faecalis]EJM6077064.1 LCP family protein [Enterococcus faecalis]MCD4889933.1 LCP family protein [Enterococcus faecalis]MCD4953342.1 LCP family protein [Enterococcus faecalis]
MSKGKKIFAIIFGIILVLFLAVVGMGAKLYWDVSKSMDKTYETVERSKKSQVNLNNKEPFSVLLLGIDTGDDGRVDQGRSDTTIVATVNPRDKQTTLVSLARDTYVDIPGQGKQDKLNHAYAFGGASLAMDTVENYLNIPINHYVSINMAGLKELVNAVGGIEVNNNLTFSQDGYDFTIGKISLNGEQALSYSRMRYEDPNGDYGRQERQRKVIEGIVQKVLSLNSVSNYQEILTAVSDNMKTDLSFDDMKKIALDYRSAFGKVKQDQLQGTGFMQDGVSYQRVDEQELTRVQQELKNQLNN